MQNLAANFTVGAGDYLAFAGIGPYYPQQPNDAVGSDATYESSSKPNTFTAIPPTTGQTFTVGAHGDPNATYDIGPDLHGNQGRSYGIGVYYTPTVPYYLNSESLGQPKLSWSDQGGQNNWVNQIGGLTSPPGPGSDVYLTNRTSAAASGSTIINFDATTDPKLSSLTINSNALSSLAYQVVELSQSANTLTSGAETIGTNGTAEHLQTGGVNNVTGALTINSSGIYDLQQGATLNASSITVNSAANSSSTAARRHLPISSTTEGSSHSRQQATRLSRARPQLRTSRRSAAALTSQAYYRLATEPIHRPSTPFRGGASHRLPLS